MSWATKSLSEVADFQLGKMLDQVKNRGDSRPYLANKNVRWGNFDLSELREMRFEEAEFERFSLKNGDIVMCEGGEPGRCAIWRDELPRMMYQKALHRIRPFDGMDSVFLFYNLSHRAHSGHFNGLFTGATIKHLPREKLALVQVDVPDLPTQTRIAGILSAYDDLIENNRRRVALLEQAARLLYREWFVHLRFPGHETAKIVDGLPEGWKQTTVFDAVDILSGGTPKTDNAEYWGDQFPFFTPKDTGEFPYVNDTEKMITEAGLKNCNSRLYEKDTLFITARGTVGKLRLAQRPMAMNQSCYALRSKCKLTQHHLYFAVSDRVNHLKAQAGGAVFAAIVVDTFKKIPLLIPSDEVAEEFARFARNALSQIDALAQQNSKLTRARDVLLPRLMDGRIPV